MTLAPVLLTTLVHLAVVVLCLYGAVRSVAGPPLDWGTQAGLFVACAAYALDAGWWCWTTRPRHARQADQDARLDQVARERYR